MQNDPDSSAKRDYGAECEEITKTTTEKIAESSTGEQKAARTSSEMPRPPTSNRHQKNKIISLGLALLGPMFAFTCAFLWLIFAHLVEPNACENSNLCLTEAQLNPSVTPDDYVVDFPAAQLVFIASWASTVSFTLIGFAMAMYSYIIAGKWLDLSDGQSRHLPTPYQTSVLLRVINTEPLVLIGLLWDGISGLFSRKLWTQDRSETSYTPKILRNGIGIFVACVATSLLIQAADTYLHVVTDAINFSEVETRAANTYLYSRGLSESCLSRKTNGEGNVNYWSCGLNQYGNGRVKTIGPVNFSEAQSTASGISRYHEVWRYNDTAVVVPKGIDSTIDFHANSFGVATQCRAIEPQSCEQDLVGNLTRFKCTKERGGVDMTFTMFRIKYQAYYFNWHQFIQEPAPFIGRESYEATEEMWDTAANLSDADAKNVFRNPWQSLVQLNVNGNDGDVMERTKDPIFFNDTLYGSSILFLTCNTTVYDVDYTAVMRNITSIKRTPSNSTTTGIVSMTTLTMWKFFGSVGSGLVDELNYLSDTGNDAVDLYAEKISEDYAAVLAAQTSPRAALSVQHRKTHVYSKIPKAAVWMQVIVNTLFMMLGMAITVAAFVRAKDSPDIHQVHVRLSITGLAAHSFEGIHAMRRARTDDDLFERRDGMPGGIVKRVALAKSSEGGSTFVLREQWEDTP